MSQWRRCDRCRKVTPTDQYDGDAATCRACLTGPVPKVRAARTSGVRTVRPARSTSAEPAAPRRPLVGVAGSGDLEVRERRARRTALDALAENHGQEFDLLLQAARRTEGLRG